MQPELTEPNNQLAMLRYRELVAEGQQQQFVTRMCVPSINTHSGSSAIRQRLGTLLVRAGQRLQSAHAITRDGLGPVAASGRGAIV